MDSQQTEITLNLTVSADTSSPPRITVPLDIDVTHTQIPSWIDMTTDYWCVWRHVYDKWRIQQKFSKINAIHQREEKGYVIACEEIDRLWYVREKLLMDHPERQDIDLRNTKTVKLVWRFLRKMQMLGYEVANFNCEKVENELRWDGKTEDESVWDKIGSFLLDQGNDGRIFIDPRDYYDHYSWCIEDSDKDLKDLRLSEFYNKFATKIDIEEEKPPVLIECKECQPSSQTCECKDGCLLCLPRADGYTPISPVSSLPSPPRTPGTSPLPSYFKGIRLPHPPEKPAESFTDEEAAEIFLSFCGVEDNKSRRKRVRIRHRNQEMEELSL